MTKEGHAWRSVCGPQNEAAAHGASRPRRRALLAAAVVLAVVAGALRGDAAETDALRQKQRAQEKARALAADLVSGILDVQIRQLQENNLQHLPIYAEIKSMSANIDQLVDREMQEVVELLVKAQQGERAERIEHFNQAREVIREVVVALMAERQKLLKRLQIARIAAQVRQLIDLQSRALDVTRSLPEKTAEQREPLTLTTIQDQRDIAALYFQLVATLQDVSTWSGPIATGAAEGLRILGTAQVSEELQQVDQSLRLSQFDQAADSQRAVIEGLRALLKIIQQTQGLIGADREAALQMVRDAIEKQEQLREKTRASELDDEETKDQFAVEQREIQQDLAALAEAVDEFPTAEPLLAQSRQAAAEAEAELFEGNRTEALLEQGQVIGGLAEIEAQLGQALQDQTSDQTADELAQEVAGLEQLEKALDQALATQQQATEQAADNAPAAAGKEAQVAQQLEQADQMGEFSRGVETRLDDAQDAVAAAREALSDAAPEAAPARSAASERAEDMVRQARAEVKSELADTRRRQLAVQVGELARAAEALERAAASERDIAQAADAAAQSDGLPAEQSKRLANEQANVAKVAEEIGAGVKNTAPQVAQQLNETKPALAQAGQQLAAAEQNPGPPSKPAATQAAASAQQAARQLETAAAELRKTAGKAAAELAQLAKEQMQPVAATRGAVEEALSEGRDMPPSPLADLRKAADAVQQARSEQLRASGQPAAADAQEQLRRIGEALGQQQAAEKAARDLAAGKASTPLAAARQQENAAQATRQLAENSDGDVAAALQEAATAAADAAKETLVGQPEKAQAARQQARQALEKAMAAAKQVAEDAADDPAGPPDLAAQQRVGKLAAAAREMVADQAADAAQALADAQQKSAAAEKALQADNADAAAPQQRKTQQALAAAAQQLQEALAGRRQQAMQQLAQQAQQNAQLAEQAAAVDPGAAAALRQAERAAQEAAADEDADMPGELPAAQAQVQRGMERAVAGLAARQQQLQRDMNIAETLAQLAMEQQQARDQIAQQAQRLEELAAAEPPAAEGDDPPAEATADEPPSAEELAAAAALQEAAEQFAEAQRATGEGAVEVSGQEQVANMPIRRGLETASELGRVAQPPMAAGEAAGEALAQADAAPADAAPADASAAPADPADTPAPAAESPPAGDQAAAPSGQGQPADAPPGGQPGPPSSELGSGFVPQSPQVTADQIAGQRALQQAAQALAQASGQAAPPQAEPSAASPSPSAQASQQPDRAAPTSPNATTGGVSSQGQAAENQPQDDAQVQTNPAVQGDSRGEQGGEDAVAAARSYQNELWFAKLPPALQNAIRTQARRRAPRGYEERLKRYFESID